MAKPAFARETIMDVLFEGDKISHGHDEYYVMKEKYAKEILRKINSEGIPTLRKDLKHTVIMITDGACRRNGKENSIGGWCAVLITSKGNKIIAKIGEGTIPETTNNKSELIAIREGFRMLKHKIDRAIVICDSLYTIGALNGTNKRKANIQLITEIESELKLSARQIQWVHTNGHNDFMPNELADVVAKSNTGS